MRSELCYLLWKYTFLSQPHRLPVLSLPKPSITASDSTGAPATSSPSLLSLTICRRTALSTDDTGSAIYVITGLTGGHCTGGVQPIPRIGLGSRGGFGGQIVTATRLSIDITGVIIDGGSGGTNHSTSSPCSTDSVPNLFASDPTTLHRTKSRVAHTYSAFLMITVATGVGITGGVSSILGIDFRSCCRMYSR